ncbi:MAG: hypothetical protein KJZ84_02985 [Bryobacteraceae bacterium]|nr:hypothetical protein [Solibacteraceae bacterium]MCL4793497.1 hypothetical protein [Bryobacteraceae bacterium]
MITNETTQTTTALPEPALTVGAEFGIEVDPLQFPWRLLEGLDRVGTGRLRVILWRLLNAADESRRGWRALACYAAAEEVWAEMQRRGCRGMDGGKGGADYRTVADAY